MAQLRQAQESNRTPILEEIVDFNIKTLQEEPVLGTTSDVILPINSKTPHDIDAEQDGFNSLAIDGIHHNYKSFLLLDSSEQIQVKEIDFLKRLKIDPENKIKVVSIVGNTGDGKSHTLNHVFFGGDDVFQTSAEQNSCTLGVWVASCPSFSTICFDTEGFLGVTKLEDQRRRMLMKVLAVSDIVIYRTRSERLHNDMFAFLSDASKAFSQFFTTALESLELPAPTKTLGPSVIIFHETRNTKCLTSTLDESAEELLRHRLKSFDAFNSIKYVGIQTETNKTDYSSLVHAIKTILEDTTVRSPRQPAVVYEMLHHLNKTFSGEIKDRPLEYFPEQYFTCSIKCESCNERCEKSMGHIAKNEPHCNAKQCIYQYQYENKVLMCKACYVNGREVIVSCKVIQSNESSWVGLAKYAWSGSVIECKNCGEIYRSRQYWYGNKNPEDSVTRSNIVHVWADSKNLTRGQNSAQLVLDGVSFLSETVANVTAQPTKNLKQWVADKVAPSYWKPNSEITNCFCCKLNFENLAQKIHHCRNCGEGVCSKCSKNQASLPNRGWNEPVRICDICKETLAKQQNGQIKGEANASETGTSDESIVYRKYGEAMINTLSTVVSLLEHPKDLIKDTARPTYWVPDNEAPGCQLCHIVFGVFDEQDQILKNSNNSNSIRGLDRRRHHCRACGFAVCNECSKNRRAVPERGWSLEVRVCDKCFTLTE